MPERRTPLHDVFAAWGAEFADRGGTLLPDTVSEAEREYQAARSDVALFDGGDRGWVEVSGPDSQDFLQRLLTSDLGRLEEGDGQWSALLDRKGKWVADLLLYRIPAEEGAAFGLDCPAERADLLAETLERMHFAERLAIRQGDEARLLVAGGRAAAALVALGAAAAEAGELYATAWGTGLLLARRDRGTPCWELLGPRDWVRRQAEALRAAGALPCGHRTLEVLRIEAFRPRFGADFDGESTLPEANEWQRASLTKGCYTGQEVVARIHTYGEAPTQLVRLDFDSGAPALHGAQLLADEKNVGRVTSWAWSPRTSRAVGLGVVRRKAAVDGAKLIALAGQERVGAAVGVPEKVVG